VSVQDAGAQLAAPLLDPRPGEAVLYAARRRCKTGHLLEWVPGSQVTAIDVDADARAGPRQPGASVSRRAWRRATPEHPRGMGGDRYDRILLDVLHGHGRDPASPRHQAAAARA